MFVEQADHRMGGILAELRRMRIGQPDDRSAEFDRCALHAEADSEEGNIALPCIADGLKFSFDSPLAESAWDEDPIEAR